MQPVVLLLVAAVAFSGCASRPPGGAQKPAEAIVTPSLGASGRVNAVNSRGRFVVLSYPIGMVPPVERRLNVYRGGLKVAEVQVTGPSRDTFTVADILAGECKIGDEVRED